MKRNNFTLTELLVSIVIIVILAAILVPTISSAIGKAEVAKAKTGITTLVNAIKQYESTYHKLPLPKDYTENSIIGNGGSSDASYKRYKWLITLLQGEEISDSKNSDLKTYGESSKYNPRKMQFLDIQGNMPGEFLDPWDNNFRIMLDKSYSGKLTNPEIPGVTDSNWKKEGSDKFLYYDIVVWSIGPDGEFDADDCKDDSNEDNIYSFNTGWDKKAGHVVQR